MTYSGIIAGERLLTAVLRCVSLKTLCLYCSGDRGIGSNMVVILSLYDIQEIQDTRNFISCRLQSKNNISSKSYFPTNISKN